MNTFENLIDNGIDEHTAVSMLESYSSKIGTKNGIYEIIDITYDFQERGRNVALKCTSCGRVIHRLVIQGRNKWSELIKTCQCQKEKKRNQKVEVFENFKNQKRAILESRIGKTFGDYAILSMKDINSIPKYTMQCTSCGCERVVSAYAFGNLDFKCHKHFEKNNYDDSYIGREFNFLTVIGIEHDDKNRRRFNCRCKCGNEKLYPPHDVVLESVKSCGCMAKQLLHDAFWKENALNRRRLYRIWIGMKQRCYNKSSENYADYGGRGIIICNEWLNSYEIFENWAFENGYADDLSIDRIDNDGNYEPKNCRWATMKVQANNKRPKKRNAQWTIGNEVKDTREWCEIFGISYETAMYRINHKGMSVYEALTTPKMAKGRNKKRGVV